MRLRAPPFFRLMTTSLRYITADVFTSQTFTGNPLAVVFGADALPTETLHAIAREFNYSETVFVFPPDTAQHTRRIRIFTPEEELPFAGHPTVGTAHVLVALGEVSVTGDEVTVVLGEGVGPVPVRVRMHNGQPVHAQLTTAMLPEEHPDVPTIAVLADMLSLSVADFIGNTHMPTVVNCGIPWLIVPLASVDAVSRAHIRMASWQQHLQGRYGSWPFVFAMTNSVQNLQTSTAGHGVDVRARAFLPGAAVPEDPATGSANACLAGYLAARTPRDGTLTWEVAQGVEMGRASRLSLEVEKFNGAIVAVRVGGATVLVSDGTMHVPSAP